LTGLLNQNCSSNWTCVSEVTADEAGTFVQGAGGSFLRDTYATQNSSVGSGTIDSVVFHARCFGSEATNQAQITFKTWFITWVGPTISLTPTWTTYSLNVVTNPFTGTAWSWSEIDALEIGISIKKSGKCTQVWAEVFHQ